MVATDRFHCIPIRSSFYIEFTPRWLQGRAGLRAQVVHREREDPLAQEGLQEPVDLQEPVVLRAQEVLQVQEVLREQVAHRARRVWKEWRVLPVSMMT